MTIEELEAYFKDKPLPKSLRISKGENIVDVRHFVDSHILVLKNYRNNKTFDIYNERLLFLKDLLEAGKVE